MRDSNSTAWTVGCKIVKWQINTQETSTLKQSPYLLLTGQRPRAGLNCLPISRKLLTALRTEAQLLRAFNLPEDTPLEDIGDIDVSNRRNRDDELCSEDEESEGEDEDQYFNDIGLEVTSEAEEQLVYGVNFFSTHVREEDNIPNQGIDEMTASIVPRPHGKSKPVQAHHLASESDQMQVPTHQGRNDASIIDASPRELRNQLRRERRAEQLLSSQSPRNRQHFRTQDCMNASAKRRIDTLYEEPIIEPERNLGLNKKRKKEVLGSCAGLPYFGTLTSGKMTQYDLDFFPRKCAAPDCATPDDLILRGTERVCATRCKQCNQLFHGVCVGKDDDNFRQIICRWCDNEEIHRNAGTYATLQMTIARIFVIFKMHFYNSSAAVSCRQNESRM